MARSWTRCFLASLMVTASIASAEEMADLTVKVTVPEGTGTVYLAGSLDELGPWNPGLFAMEGMGRERHAKLQVPAGTEVSFKFTAGSWAREAVDMNCMVPPNTTLMVQGDMEHHSTVTRFRSPDQECPWPDPAKWESAIAAFEEEDQKDPPKPGLILCTGSSSMALWHPTLAADLAPLEVLPRGFGGSTINDLMHFADRVVLPYKPSAILVYEGDNDIAAGVFPETVLKRYREFLDLVEEKLPETEVYVLAVKPSTARWDQWERQAKVNDGLRQMAEELDHVTYIDVASPMLGEDGKPRPELFREDNLHMNEQGYALWTEKVREVLLPTATKP